MVLVPGENMPFAHVNWMTLQSVVVSTGAVFSVQPVEIGANQLPIPIGDPHFVTCGPFQCAEGMDPPEITIADSGACADWEYTIDLHVGFVDNTAENPDSDTNGDTDGFQQAATGDATLDDGVDIGWLYTSSSDITVKHHFGSTVVDGADNKKKSVTTALGLTGGGVGQGDYRGAVVFPTVRARSRLSS